MPYAQPGIAAGKQAVSRRGEDAATPGNSPGTKRPAALPRWRFAFQTAFL